MTDDLQFWNDAMPGAAKSVANLPAHMHDALTGFVVRGRHIGDFLTALFSGEPVWIVLGKADDDNQRAILQWAMVIYNACPPGCYGSKERVERWIEHGGLRGISAEDAA